MNMRILLAIFSLMSLNLASASSSHRLIGGMGTLPPEYLHVPQWQKCVQSLTCGSAKFVTLPKSKPAGCPSDSWLLLKNKHLLSDYSKGCKGLSSLQPIKKGDLSMCHVK